METVSVALQVLFAIPVIAGTAFALIGIGPVWLFMRRTPLPLAAGRCGPTALLKPVCGLEKRLEENLRSCCEQDHPDFQVIFSVQSKHDAALPLLLRLQEEYGAERVSIAVASKPPMPNGKIHNLVGAMEAVRNEILVLSDSDIELAKDYLRIITAPLEDPEVGFVCTPYKGVQGESWYERLELLSLHDYTTQVVFAWMTGASDFCLGGSVAFRRSDLERIGGFEPLQDYLVEDYEMGQRLLGLGLRQVVLPSFVDTVIDLPSARSWWQHMVYWDQNTWAARPLAFIATVLVRPVPFALLFALARGFDAVGLGVLAATLVIRLASSAATMTATRDSEGLQNLVWLPLRDLAGLVSWLAALRSRELVWRGLSFNLTSDGRLVPANPGAVAVGTTSETPEFSNPAKDSD